MPTLNLTKGGSFAPLHSHSSGVGGKDGYLEDVYMGPKTTNRLQKTTGGKYHQQLSKVQFETTLKEIYKTEPIYNLHIAKMGREQRGPQPKFHRANVFSKKEQLKRVIRQKMVESFERQ